RSHAQAHPVASTLSLHDALPILCIAGATATGAVAARRVVPRRSSASPAVIFAMVFAVAGAMITNSAAWPSATCRTCATSSCTLRSEEHTSELQSRENLVCRLLLE